MDDLDDLNFDSLEEKIRGEDIMRDQERKKDIEERAIKKELQKNEVEKRLQDLKKKLKK